MSTTKPRAAPRAHTSIEPRGGNGQADTLPEDPPPEKEKMNLARFIETHKDAIAKRVIESYPPLYQPNQGDQNAPLPKLLRRPIGAQEHALRGVILSLKENQGTTVVGEMGTGKTFIGATAAYVAGFKHILVLCPPHLVRKWKREIEITVPGARAVIVQSITDMNRLKEITGDGPLFVIMSRERAKLSYLWKPAIVHRYQMINDELQRDDTGYPLSIICCPQCNTQVVDNEGLPIPYTTLDRKHHTCDSCNGALWQADNSGRRRYALADYTKLRLKDFFDLLICDEVHEYKGQGTAQGIAGGVLASLCKRSLVLTGTLMGGYSSTLFHLLYRFSPQIKSEFKHSDRSRWIDRYGFRQKTIKHNADTSPYAHGRGSHRKQFRTVEKETPGLAPSALFHLIDNSVFLRLSDVTNKLPPYEEKVVINHMSDQVDDGSTYSQATAYQELFDDLLAELSRQLAKGSQKLLGKYLQSLLSYPDACTKGETVCDPDSGDIIAAVPPLSQERIYPKEQALIDLVTQEKASGRRVLAYVTHTNKRDITVRMDEFLTRAGFKVAVLKSNTNQKTDQREAWINDKVAQGIDVLVCNPRLVQTGLDLVDFPTICWYETDYSIYTMRQASRRSWRIGQTQPVQVLFFLYHKTLQSDALKLIAKKMQSALAVEGELPEDGLVAYGDNQDDLIIALAKQIINGDTSINSNEQNDSVEEIFARARDAETEGQELLVNDEWRLPTPSPNADQSELDQEKDGQEKDGQQQTGRPEPDRPQPVTTSPGQVRISWTKFMEQPAEKTARRSKKPAEAMSLFQWAIGQEAQEN